MEPPPELHLREGFVVGQPIPAPPYMAQGMTPGTIRLIPSPPYMATGQLSMIPPGSVLSPPGFAPQTPDGRLPSSILHPQPSGYPATAWSPGPILDFYNQYDDPGMRRGNGNRPPHTLSSMQHPPPPQPTQAGCSGYYIRPAQTIPQNQAVHPTLSSHSAQSSQQNQLTQLPYLPSAQQYPYQAGHVSNYPGAPSVSKPIAQFYRLHSNREAYFRHNSNRSIVQAGKSQCRKQRLAAWVLDCRTFSFVAMLPSFTRKNRDSRKRRKATGWLLIALD